MAIARADPRVCQHILHGDLLSVDLQPGYDLIVGLDVFAHLNPNRFDAYLARLTEPIDDHERTPGAWNPTPATRPLSSAVAHDMKP